MTYAELYVCEHTYVVSSLQRKKLQLQKVLNIIHSKDIQNEKQI